MLLSSFVRQLPKEFLFPGFCFITYVRNNVAIPAILHGTDVVPVSGETISNLNVVQNKLGKSLLGIPPSTGNPVVNVELGWKPFHLRVSQAKLSYFKHVQDLGFKGSPLVAVCMLWNVSFSQTLYMKNLREMFSLYSSGDDFLSLTVKVLCAFHEQSTLSKIQLLPLLRLMPILRKWWRRNQLLFSSVGAVL